MTPTIEAPAPGFPVLRATLNMASQVALATFLTCRITGKILSAPFAWRPYVAAAIVILCCIGILLTFLAALRGHEPSIAMLRCYWRSEKASGRLFTAHALLLAFGIAYLVAPWAIGYLLLALPGAFLLKWWLCRRIRR